MVLLTINSRVDLLVCHLPEIPEELPSLKSRGSCAIICQENQVA